MESHEMPGAEASGNLESESWLYARSLAASPFERRMMNETYIRSLPSSVRYRLRRFGS